MAKNFDRKRLPHQVPMPATTAQCDNVRCKGQVSISFLLGHGLAQEFMTRVSSSPSYSSSSSSHRREMPQTVYVFRLGHISSFIYIRPPSDGRKRRAANVQNGRCVVSHKTSRRE